MTISGYIEAVAVPVKYSPDDQVQGFVECSIWNFNPRVPQWTTRDLLSAALWRFGPDRCAGLGFWVH